MGKLSLHIAAFFLTALMFIKMLGMPLVFISYQVNKDYIASQLCENRAKPQLHCNGQCVLMKKLAKANDSNESKDTKAEVKSIVLDFVEELPQIAFNHSAQITQTFSAPAKEPIHSDYISSIFHPPGQSGGNHSFF